MPKFALLCLTVSVFAAAPAVAGNPSAQWQGTVARLIASHQNYPRSAQIRGEEGVSRVRISLAPDGHIGQVDLAASSGSAILDREAQSIINTIGKFPPPPAGVKSLLVPIVWRLN